MTIYLASDHGGFELKKKLAKHLKQNHFQAIDLGPHKLDPTDDYPDFAVILINKVVQDSNAFGILICRSGIGMAVISNKAKGIRAGLCTYVAQAQQAREHVDCNVLVLDSDYSDRKEATKIADAFLNTKFSGDERHLRRINKIKRYEENIVINGN